MVVQLNLVVACTQLLSEAPQPTQVRDLLARAPTEWEASPSRAAAPEASATTPIEMQLSAWWSALRKEASTQVAAELTVRCLHFAARSYDITAFATMLEGGAVSSPKDVEAIFALLGAATQSTDALAQAAVLAGATTMLLPTRLSVRSAGASVSASLDALTALLLANTQEIVDVYAGSAGFLLSTGSPTLQRYLTALFVNDIERARSTTLQLLTQLGEKLPVPVPYPQHPDSGFMYPAASIAGFVVGHAVDAEAVAIASNEWFWLGLAPERGTIEQVAFDHLQELWPGTPVARCTATSGRACRDAMQRHVEEHERSDARTERLLDWHDVTTSPAYTAYGLGYFRSNNFR